jgi:hypothetical protein
MAFPRASTALTPFGDCSLIRMANLYANICQVGKKADMLECFNMVTRRPAEMMCLVDYGLAVIAYLFSLETPRRRQRSGARRIKRCPIKIRIDSQNEVTYLVIESDLTNLRL